MLARLHNAQVTILQQLHQLELDTDEGKSSAQPTPPPFKKTIGMEGIPIKQVYLPRQQVYIVNRVTSAGPFTTDRDRYAMVVAVERKHTHLGILETQIKIKTDNGLQTWRLQKYLNLVSSTPPHHCLKIKNYIAINHCGFSFSLAILHHDDRLPHNNI